MPQTSHSTVSAVFTEIPLCMHAVEEEKEEEDGGDEEDAKRSFLSSIFI